MLGRCSRSRDFWLLFGSFFVCGLSTNGLIGTHLIAACIDHGIAATSAAGLLAMMGIFDIVGTTGSGWLSDRYDNRRLLCMYYGLRGLSLIYLPYSGYSLYGLSLFAVFYGLDWLATVPPTLRLTTDAFGRADAPIVFGWILTGHQLGAAVAAFGAGYPARLARDLPRGLHHRRHRLRAHRRDGAVDRRRAPPRAGGRERGLIAARAVDLVVERLAGERAADVVDHAVGRDRRHRVARDVRRDQDLGVLPERAVRRQRLVLEDVERGAGEMAGSRALPAGPPRPDGRRGRR